ncbi:HET-domain-containing protein, partial [Thozetella sp. PMI_491]
MGISSYQQAPDGEAQANEFSCSLVTARPDYALIGSWIRGCVSNHPSCTPEHDMETLSRIRLVDVQDRMVVPYDPNISSHYVALSYVWGRVRQASVALWSPLPPLPATIEDAMTVVRTLGFRYLWVDSLCIDQESEEHKASQINIMASIYRSAYVTIINLSGTSALSGLSGVSIDRSISQFRCTLDESTILVSTLPALAAYTRQSPWSSRAWVLQEALLSRRKLFFTQSQVYFECAEYQTSE